MGFLDDVGTFFDVIINPEEYEDKGKTGERFTYRKLKDSYFAKDIFRNVYIKRNNGMYTEIDLVSIGRGAVIAYESKNYSGSIYGNANDSTWTAWLNPKSKHRFPNPVVQNSTHIQALREYLSAFPFEYHSVIVFSERCKLAKITCDLSNTHVIKRENLIRTVDKIRSNAAHTLTAEQLDEARELLRKVQRPDEEIRKEHLDAVTKNCPRCNVTLVEKTNKKDGGKFLACPNYPRCRFTRNID
ncbi:MAG: NERD domain-containing protein [Oscillospiraceae bacterium]|nr:NERD domain-containing protein [Oscillospiraceae bacterium]